MTTTDNPQVLYEHVEQDSRKRRKGWICPRCERVNAPHVEKCDCEPKASASVGPSEFK